MFFCFAILFSDDGRAVYVNKKDGNLPEKTIGEEKVAEKIQITLKIDLGIFPKMTTHFII